MKPSTWVHAHHASEKKNVPFNLLPFNLLVLAQNRHNESGLTLQAAFADNNIAKSSSVYYGLGGH